MKKNKLGLSGARKNPTGIVRSLLYIILALLSPRGIPLAGQESLNPEAPEIVLPSQFLEIREDEILLIEAPLPGENQDSFAALEIPLPAPEELTFSSLGINLPGHEGMGSGYLPAGGSSFFTEAAMGIGTDNHILGDIVLYKLGDNPRFQIHFLHQGWDGFAGHDPGEGYSRRREFLGGELELSGRRYQSATELYYSENDFGLQGKNPVYQSLTNRTYSAFTGYSFAVSPRWKLLADGGIKYTAEVFGGGSPEGVSELSFNPRLGFSFHPSVLDWDLFAGYRFRDLRSGGADLGAVQALTAETGIFWPLPGGLDLEVRAGVAWEPDRYTRFPFSISLKRDAGRFFNFTLAGGYRVEPFSLETLWGDFPFLKSRYAGSGSYDIMEDRMGWAVTAEGRLTLSPSLNFTLRGEYRRWENALAAAAPDADGFYLLESREMDNLAAEILGEWQITRTLVFRANWRGQLFLDHDLLAPVSALGVSIDWSSREDRFGLSAGAVLDRYSADQSFLVNTWVPRLGFSGFYRIIPGIKLYLEGTDVLAPLLDGGRKIWDGYNDIGGAVSIKIGISL